MNKSKNQLLPQNKVALVISLAKQMRPHQWAKNIIIFIPLLTSHNYLDSSSAVNITIAFICFCICSSGVYFTNDLIDIDEDRNHENKKYRPLANGDLPISLGISGGICLPIISFFIAILYLPYNFFLSLIAYFLLSTSYTFIFKKISTADVMILAALYTIRVIAGSAAILVSTSAWLMAFSVFIFVSLAYLKRFIELNNHLKTSSHYRSKNYSFDDIETMFNLGISNMTASVLILALYINSSDVINKYQSPDLLWLLCFLMLYWGNRIWIGARRNKINEDPVLFVIKDKISILVGILFLLTVFAAKYYSF